MKRAHLALIAALLTAFACGESAQSGDDDENGESGENGAGDAGSSGSSGTGAGGRAGGSGSSGAAGAGGSTAGASGTPATGGGSGTGARDAGPDADPGEPGITIGTTEFCSVDGWCWENPLPQGLHLNDVFVRGPSDVWIAGDHGTLLHYNGVDWRRVDVGDPGSLHAVVAFTPNDVWVGGQNGVLHFDGVNWTPVGAEIPLAWVSVLAGSSSNDVWIVSTTPSAVYHYTGPDVALERSPLDPVLNSPWDLQSFAPDDVWGAVNAGLVHWDGRTWETMPDFPYFPYLSLWAASGDDIWLGASTGYFVHWDGSSAEITDLVTDFSMWGMWGSAPDDIWAAAQPPSSSQDPWTLFHFDGESWQMRDPGGGGMHMAVHGSGADDAWFVGRFGAMQHFDGESFSERRSATSQSLYDVWASSEEDVWAVDFDAGVVHFDGETWSRSQLPATYLWAIFGSAPDDVWAAGDGVYHFDGNEWTTAVASNGVPGEAAIWGVSSDDIWIGVEDGSFFRHFDGETVNIVPRGLSTMVNGIWGSATDDVWAVGPYGNAEHWDGASWEFVETGMDDDLYAVWGSAANDVWAVGARGRILRYRGVGWSVAESPTAVTLRAIWGSAAGNIFVAGDAGEIYRYDGVGWTREQSGGGTDLNDARITALFGLESKLWAVGWNGTILGRALP